MARRDPARPIQRTRRRAAARRAAHPPAETSRQIRTAAGLGPVPEAAARLPGESWANVLLISSRIPDATLVKGYEAWRSAGRQVNRDEKGIEIFSPRDRTERNRHDPGDKQSRS